MSTSVARGRLPVIGIAGTTTWVAWIERFADAHGVNRQELVEASLKETALRAGFEPPPDRVPRRTFRLPA